MSLDFSNNYWNLYFLNIFSFCTQLLFLIFFHLVCGNISPYGCCRKDTEHHHDTEVSVGERRVRMDGREKERKGGRERQTEREREREGNKI